MRILLLPLLYGSQQLAAISNVNAFFDLARALTAVRQDVFVHVALPERGHWQYSESLYAGERIAPLVHKAYMDLPERQLPLFYEQMWTDVGLWNVLNDKTKSDLVFDVVLNARPELSILLKNVMSYTTQLWRDTPIVNFVNDMPWIAEQREQLQRAYALNWVCDWVQFTLPNDATLGRQVLRRYVSPAELLRVTDPSFVVPMAIDFSLADRITEELGPRPARLPRVFYGGRLMGKKRLQESIDLMQPLWTTGRLDRYHVTTQSTDPAELATLRDRPDVMLYGTPSSRELFLRRCQDGDVFHCLSTNEGFGSGYFEMQLRGLVGVWLQAPWLRGNLPEDYPFLATSMQEVVQMTSWIVDHLDDARAKAEPARAFLRQRFAAENVARHWLVHIERIVERHRTQNRRSGDKSKLVLELLGAALTDLNGFDEFGMNELVAAVKRTSRGGFDLRKMRFRVGKGAVVDGLRRLGWIDSCQLPEIRFVRA